MKNKKCKPLFYSVLVVTTTFLFVLEASANAALCSKLLAVNADVYQLKNKTTAELVQRYHSFQQESNKRYEEFRRGAYSRNDQQTEVRRKLYDEEKTYLNNLKVSLGSRPASERLAYMRSLTKEELIRNSAILDDLFGLQIREMDETLKTELESGSGLDRSKLRERYGDEEIWYAPGGGQQSSWPRLIEVVDAMNLQSGQLVSDLGSGIGRLGLLIGLLRPDVNFVGLEIVGERVKYATIAAKELGFDSVTFYASNLSDPTLHLPQADHIYMFNPTNERTSEIVTNKLVQLSQDKKFRVYLLTYLRSKSFSSYFRQVESSPVSIYERSKP